METFIFIAGIASGIFTLVGVILAGRGIRKIRRLYQMEKEIAYRKVLNLYGWQDYAYIPPMIFSQEKELEEAFRWMQEHGRVITDEKGEIVGRFDTSGNHASIGYSILQNEKDNRVIPSCLPSQKISLKVLHGKKDF